MATDIKPGDTVSVLARNPLGKPTLARVLEVMDDSARHGDLHGMRYRLDDGTIKSAYWVKALPEASDGE